MLSIVNIDSLFHNFPMLFCSLKDAASQDPYDFFPKGGSGSDLLYANLKAKHHSAYPPRTSGMQYGSGNSLNFWETKTSRRVEQREGEHEESLLGVLNPGNTTEDWSKATESFKKSKEQFASIIEVSANLRTFPQEDITPKTINTV